MKRTFDQALADFVVGEIIRVSDGFPEPSDPASIDHAAWRSHNFEGELVAAGADVLEFRVVADENVILHPRIERGRWPHHFERLNPTIGDARAEAWEAVKRVRDRCEDGLADTPLGHPVNTDDRSKIKLSGLTQMASFAIQDEQMAAAAEGRPFDPSLVAFSEDFTMGDNVVVQLSAFDAIAIGKAAGLYVSRCHAVGRQLRAWIDDPERTLEELQGFDAESEFATQLAALLAA
ncbi:MAG: hypothetical protein ACK40O_06080 [Allosphingosinicella sp.]